jgi:hypothetical protein
MVDDNPQHALGEAMFGSVLSVAMLSRMVGIGLLTNAAATALIDHCLLVFEQLRGSDVGDGKAIDHACMRLQDLRTIYADRKPARA